MTAAPNVDALTRAAEEIHKQIAALRVPTASDSAAEQSILKNELANGKRLNIDSNNMTGGMKAQCSSQLGQRYREWLSLNARFRDSITSFSGNIAKFENIDKEIEKNEKELADAEQIVLRQWRHAQSYKFAKSEYDAAETAYLSFRDREGQREPKVVSWVGKIGTLLLIGAVEWLINFEAFSATFGVPILAAGFTIAVALAVAVASHWHGVFFKQREYYFGDHLTAPNKFWRLVWLFFVTLALIGALVFVGWNRYIWAMEIIARTTTGPVIVETDPIKIDAIQKVLMSLLGNVIVWIVGTALVYWLHDPNPEFADAFVRRRKWGKLYSRYKGRIDDQIRAFVARREKEINALELKRKAEEDRDPQASQIAKFCRDVRRFNTTIERAFQNAMQDCMEQYRFALFKDEKASDIQIYKAGTVLRIDQYLALPLPAQANDILGRTGG
jgi:hypothetical protein